MCRFSDRMLLARRGVIDAESLAEALSFVLSGNGTFEERLAAHETARNERVRPLYEFTSQLAALEPSPPEMQDLFRALYGNQDATNAFLSAITGAIPLPDFMSNENLDRIMAAAKDVEFPQMNDEVRGVRSCT